MRVMTICKRTPDLYGSSYVMCIATYKGYPYIPACQLEPFPKLLQSFWATDLAATAFTHP